MGKEKHRIEACTGSSSQGEGGSTEVAVGTGRSYEIIKDVILACSDGLGMSEEFGYIGGPYPCHQCSLFLPESVTQLLVTLKFLKPCNFVSSDGKNLFAKNMLGTPNQLRCIL